MKKRGMAALLALVMLLSCLPGIAWAQEDAGGAGTLPSEEKAVYIRSAEDWTAYAKDHEAGTATKTTLVLAEDIDFTKDLSVPLSKYIHSKNKTFCWIPYWQAKGYNQWRELGFDIAYQQPNHFFKASIPDKRLEEACQSAATLNMGMELEFDERALFDAKDSFYNRLVAYIDHFERQQAFRTSAMAYYSGNHAVLDMYKSTNPKDHEVMDRLANLIVSRRGKQKK